ncbi:MAG: hypothetical protein GC146_13940 [Limimaricola sp.]|uniref:hypothetical protein n=1 Tax=Limimaricola sp. TaxID=2211665 RepID=UPI001DFD1089|nr:hypothetical protein [Limimaricola sp.]MBI1418317.1 hypothetical protein [Limimaricola sp.]
MEQILRTILRMVLNRGINSGIRTMSNRGRDPREMTPEERAKARGQRQNMQQARRAVNLLRRFGRF